MAFSFEPVRDSTNICRYPRDFSIYNDPTTIVLSPTFTIASTHRFYDFLPLSSLTTVRSTSTLASPLHQFFAFLSPCPIPPLDEKHDVFTRIHDNFLSPRRNISSTNICYFIHFYPPRANKQDRSCRPSIFILPRMALLPV